MNTLNGIVESVTVKKSLSLVKVKAGPFLLTTIVIDTPDSSPYLKSGNPVHVIFKETEVIIGKGNNHQISLQNKIKGTIETIESGELLSKVSLDTEVGKIVSVITTNAVNQLQLEIGAEVTAMVKTNEVMLAE
ncbi:MAG: TOBE domain-containing protein [Saprospiraceae bacterium]|nr:TOBE domain-containing protein [Saprospiraceae bacterium]